jgi:hypothetical protein
MVTKALGTGLRRGDHIVYGFINFWIESPLRLAPERSAAIGHRPRSRRGDEKTD